MDTNANRTPEEIIEALNKQIAEQNEIINGQADALKAAETQGASALPVITHEKKQYQVLAKQFTFESKLVKAEDLKTNKDLVKALLKAEAGILQLVVEKEAAEPAAN
ncbi:hypothetical protein Q5H93_23995 [Hymenobacter sp. ASUV-10]|uniref:Uncharacterized protein n=1 Tax=Hymenobacter aranciens TaxID=3063996 RepID=A0ABT9BHT7_9BACT|nr:hypothetical protein [Hymenobacter sp. ASUV-10]MDO7877820.1 hypothetical protein [Hymenobacter sp. ASUV-10]